MRILLLCTFVGSLATALTHQVGYALAGPLTGLLMVKVIGDWKRDRWEARQKQRGFPVQLK